MMVERQQIGYSEKMCFLRENDWGENKSLGKCVDLFGKCIGFKMNDSFGDKSKFVKWVENVNSEGFGLKTVVFYKKSLF